jgi:hypothetical protein
MNDKARQRIIWCFAHPATLGAVLLLLLNDHVFKHLWPSWLTGKLSDFAGLVFAPFLVGIVLSILIPRRWPRGQERVGNLAVILTGMWFALMKSVPAWRDLTVESIHFVMVSRAAILCDPTDLITLPALLIPWWLWKQCGRRESGQVNGWFVLALGALATVATSPAPVDLGINCLGERGSDIFAINGGYAIVNVYSSQDGGLSWKTATLRDWSPFQDCQRIVMRSLTAPQSG